MRLLSLAVLLLHGLVFAQSVESRLERPKDGGYQHLWIKFDGEQPANAFVGFRSNQSTTAWFVGGAVPGGVKATSAASRVLIESARLSLEGDSLKGTIRLRQVVIWAPMKELAKVSLTLEGKKTGDRFEGSWQSELAEGRKAQGKFKGSLLSEAAIRKEQAFDPNASWSTYHGRYGTNRAAETRSALIDDLNDARPVWRSEAKTLSGWGSGVDGRYPTRAAFGTVCGGAGTPIFADGKIYLFHYVPSGEPDQELLAKALADFKKSNGREPSPEEKAGLTDFSRPLSDTIITCLDAETGATLWTLVFPQLSGNYQTHKWRGLNPTVTVIGPVLIATDYGQNWIGVKAATGEVLWTIKGKQKVQNNQAYVGATRAGDLAILPGEKVRAVEPATGKIVWEQPGGSQVLPFGKDGVDGVVVIGRSNPIAYESATGKTLWKIDEVLAGTTGSAALTQGELLVGYVANDSKKSNDKKPGGIYQGWKLSKENAKKIWQDATLEWDENLTVTLSEKYAFLVGRDQVRCLELATGKKIGQLETDPKTDAIGSNQWLAVVGDRLILSPEGQHGNQRLKMLTADPKMHPLGKLWIPPNNHTTAYAMHAMGFPIVDGRIFIRGMDGIYCYDLRKKK